MTRTKHVVTDSIIVAALLACTLFVQSASAGLVKLNPTADGYTKVKSGTTILDNNAGGTLRVGREKVFTSWYTDRGIFQFDVSGIDLSQVESALLKLTLKSKYIQSGDPHLMLYRSATDTWAESGTTLTGVPTGGLPLDEMMDRKLGSTLATDGQVLSFDLLNGTSPYTWETTTPWNLATEADGKLSLLVKISNNVGEESSMSSKRYYDFYSKECATEAYRPVLELTMVPEPATMSLLGLGAVALLRRKR